jgi:hypothetical protein
VHINWPTRSLSYQLLIQRSEIKKRIGEREKHIEKPKKKEKKREMYDTKQVGLAF